MGRPIPGLKEPTPGLNVCDMPKRVHARPEMDARLESIYSVAEGPFHAWRTLVSSEGSVLCARLLELWQLWFLHLRDSLID